MSGTYKYTAKTIQASKKTIRLTFRRTFAVMLVEDDFPHPQ